MRVMRTLLSMLAAAALSCGGSGITDYATEQSAMGACVMPPVTLTGTGAAGTGCNAGSACAPACCQCQIGGMSSSFELAACQDGVCAQDLVVCEDAENRTLCP